MNLTTAQKFALVLVTLGVLGTAGKQLSDMFGPNVSNYIVNISLMASTILGGWLSVITGQAAQVKNVAAMPGVENIEVNRQANQTLARVAMDPDELKISPLVRDSVVINAKAQGDVA